MTRSAIKPHEFSHQSLLLAAVFIVALVVAFIIVLAVVLQYFGLVSGLPPTTVEIGATILALTIAPLLLMGMSISADMDRNKRNANN